MTTLDPNATAPFSANLPERLEKRIEWYNKMAERHMYWYQSLKAIQIAAGVMIPIAAIVFPDTTVRRATAILGCLVAGIETFLQFMQYHQHWMRWRAAENRLQREKWLFIQNAGKYTDPETKDVLLAETVEDIISNEFQTWHSEEEKRAKKSPA